VPDIILIATGSEVELAVEVSRVLENKGRGVRVVSMPCMDMFEEQSEEYKQSILPKAVTRRIAIEALSTFGWGRYVGPEGKIIGMTSFGASGAYKELFKHFGFTADEIVKIADNL
jgi:transketolase